MKGFLADHNAVCVLITIVVHCVRPAWLQGLQWDISLVNLWQEAEAVLLSFTGDLAVNAAAVDKALLYRQVLTEISTTCSYLVLSRIL